MTTTVISASIAVTPMAMNFSGRDSPLAVPWSGSQVDAECANEPRAADAGSPGARAAAAVGWLSVECVHGASARVTGAPHWPQYLAVSGTGFWQSLQVMRSRV